MSFKADVLNIMIASPGDVKREREAIKEIIHDWNSAHAISEEIVLLPVGWESHSAPVLSGRAQEAINEEVLEICDLLVGVFWTRLGTPTGKHASGTVEEIKEHHKAGKPAMIYFSNEPVVMSSVDHEQYQGLQDFKEWCQQEGLTGEYNSIEDFRDQFRQHLIARVRSVAKKYGLKGGDVDFRQIYIDARDGVDNLPDLALDLLQSAALDQNGVLIKQQFLNGFGVQAGRKSYEVGDHAAYAEFEEMFELLEAMGLIRSANQEGSVYRLTAAGYRKGK